MMKKIFFVAICLAAVFATAAAEGLPESAPEATTQPSMEIDPVTASLAVLKGPTGFGYVHLLGDSVSLGRGVMVEAEVLPSPTEAIARVISGSVDLATLPANAAVLLYNKGVPIRLAAVTGEGMLYLLSRDSGVVGFSRDMVQGLLDDGKSLYVPAPGSTPDLVTRYLLDSWGFDESEREELVDLSIASPAQVAQMLIAGKIEYAVLPEPFATMADLKSDAVSRTANLQELWEIKTGISNYPMTALVVQNDFADNHPEAMELILASAASSIDRVVQDPAEAAVLIEQFGILTAALAKPSIPRCELMFQTAEEAAAAYDQYLAIMAGLDPATIGGSLPDEAFYTGN